MHEGLEGLGRGGFLLRELLEEEPEAEDVGWGARGAAGSHLGGKVTGWRLLRPSLAVPARNRHRGIVVDSLMMLIRPHSNVSGRTLGVTIPVRERRAAEALPSHQVRDRRIHTRAGRDPTAAA